MPDGWTSIIVLILFFGGVQLISIGLIGEYVGRTYLNINKKAQFIIRDRI
jgi:undecaprenyl-phosphate 4-deoxy-4-formamido-L-arabinose transferase